SGSSTSYGYDQADRLITATVGGTNASYVYDGDGLRASKTVNGTTTSETWDTAEGLPLLVQDGGTRYVTGPDGRHFEQIAADGTATAQSVSRDPLVNATGQPYGEAAEDPLDAADPTGLDYSLGDAITLKCHLPTWQEAGAIVYHAAEKQAGYFDSLTRGGFTW